MLPAQPPTGPGGSRGGAAVGGPCRVLGRPLRPPAQPGLSSCQLLLKPRVGGGGQRGCERPRTGFCRVKVLLHVTRATSWAAFTPLHTLTGPRADHTSFPGRHTTRLASPCPRPATTTRLAARGPASHAPPQPSAPQPPRGHPAQRHRVGGRDPTRGPALGQRRDTGQQEAVGPGEKRTAERRGPVTALHAPHHSFPSLPPR